MLPPTNILLIKSHSMGIGDLLRSSTAWRVLKNRWPQAQLHLLMLSKHAGYASEGFIRAHHLLDSATFITAKAGDPAQPQRSMSFFTMLKTVDTALTNTPIDMVIDCEPYGIKTSLLARSIARRKGGISVGIAQFPLRKYFYDMHAPSVPKYMATNGFFSPMDYTERDFVVLAALGLQRQGTRIELRAGVQGLTWQQQHKAHFDPVAKHVVLNIGCGTADALSKRPPMRALVSAMVAWYQRTPFILHLTGADFEQQVNDDFVRLYTQELAQLCLEAKSINWAGHCSLNELCGLIALADVMVSSDSGPYHMGVALGVPTLCWFNFDTPASYHQHSDVVIQTLPAPDEFADAATRLLVRSSV